MWSIIGIIVSSIGLISGVAGMSMIKYDPYAHDRNQGFTEKVNSQGWWVLWAGMVIIVIGMLALSIKNRPDWYEGNKDVITITKSVKNKVMGNIANKGNEYLTIDGTLYKKVE